LYQDVLWVAESEPNLAWIMLVSAVEAAANRGQTSKDEPLLRLCSGNPDLFEGGETRKSTRDRSLPAGQEPDAETTSTGIASTFERAGFKTVAGRVPPRPIMRHDLKGIG
jgi:hypothetical protein